MALTGGTTVELKIDVEEMTLAEMEFFEEQSGVSIQDLASGNVPVRALLALITIQERRRDPKYTMDDARKLKFRDVDLTDAVDPTEGAADGS